MSDSEVLIYRDIPHTYHGTVSGEQYASVSAVFHLMKLEQDWDGILMGSARKQGVDHRWLKAEWDRKKHMGTTAGTIAHKKREVSLLESFVVDLWGEEYFPVPYIMSDTEDDVKYQIKDIKASFVYPELIVSYPTTEILIAGTSDEVYIDKNNRVHIWDTKTDKSIDFRGYRNQTLVNGLEHRQDCNFDAYSIKCSTYMYLLLLSHPHLSPGSITLRHTPIARDEDGCAIINDDGTVDVLDEYYHTVDYEANKGDVEIMLEYYKNWSLKHKKR